MIRVSYKPINKKKPKIFWFLNGYPSRDSDGFTHLTNDTSWAGIVDPLITRNLLPPITHNFPYMIFIFYSFFSSEFENNIVDSNINSRHLVDNKLLKKYDLIIKRFYIENQNLLGFKEID